MVGTGALLLMLATPFLLYAQILAPTTASQANAYAQLDPRGALHLAAALSFLFAAPLATDAVFALASFLELLGAPLLMLVTTSQLPVRTITTAPLANVFARLATPGVPQETSALLCLLAAPLTIIVEIV